MTRSKKQKTTQLVGVSVLDDGLLVQPAGPWTVEKYAHATYYEEIFATGMKDSWRTRVYIELYCGCGRVSLGGGRIVESSPILALGIKDPFDRYVFCDADEDRLDALQKRVEAKFGKTRDVRYVLGDVNERADDIASHIPKSDTLSFCFADPYDLGIHFKTIETLARGRPIDFLILLALHTDAKRALTYYLEPDHRKMAEFLGREDWRPRWLAFERGPGRTLVEFLAREYVDRMVDIGYLRSELNDMIQIKSHDKNLPKYYLAFFSKHEKGGKFWKQALKYSLEPSLFQS